MTPISEEQLKAIMPKCGDPALWCAPLNDAMDRFAINNPQRAAAFLAQIAHESGELCRLAENLNYAAKRLMQVWPKRFPTLEKAEMYARNPAKLANYVYAKRLGNGDEQSGDGWRYRGRGVIQVTGRGNYRTIGAALGLPLEAEPQRLEQPGAAALSAAYFWQSRGLNELADDRNDDDDDEDFVRISVLINGGKTGLKERRAYWAMAKSVLA
ncbi:MAG: glycoside hydrolase family 19 protein [Deltaproteobacteria bacterium]|nr:glycoside hydrolase family 19 protein [Deltaproteobacteria bacterium]